ncbi:MAG: hypothetical protein HYY16_15110 [Planctomycetes bacterium]|nr:hypothetical protein [Planctomycetota bacterium]
MALVLGLVLIVDTLASRRWESAGSRTRELLDEVQKARSTRPVLRGSSVPGNAWEDYWPAIKVLDGLRKEIGDWTDFALCEPRGDRDAAQRLFMKYRADLDQIRRGTFRAECRFPYDWVKGGSGATMPFTTGTLIGQLLVCGARFLEEEGKGQEAARMLLDTVQFGRDVTHNTESGSLLIGAGICHMGLNGLKWLITSGRLSPNDLDEIGHELEIIESSIPGGGQSFLVDRVLAGMTLMSSHDSVLGVLEVQKRCMGEANLRDYGRYFFSARLMEADALERMEAWSRRAVASEHRPWTELRDEFERIKEEHRASRNPVLRIAGHPDWHHMQYVREIVARVRLLRNAISFKRGEPLAASEDPFGGTLLKHIEGSKARLWSVGRDGLNNGGVAEFDWLKWTRDGEDLVIEVQR